MKNTLIFILMVFVSYSCSAQLNNLNDFELFDGIKFNNFSLGEIMNSQGDLGELRSGYSFDLQEENNNSAPFLAKEISNNSIVFSFEDETDTGNMYNLSSIYVLTNSVEVNVKNLSIRIGDDKSEFGSIPFNSRYNGYVFTDADTGSISLAFKINKFTKKVESIEFIAF